MEIRLLTALSFHLHNHGYEPFKKWVADPSRSFMASVQNLKLWSPTVKLTLAIFATALSTIYMWRKHLKVVKNRVQELEKSLNAALEKCASERKGRIRAQQALRKALSGHNSDKSGFTSYPMTPIATVQSCFSTRNGTPRQPLLIPLARACLVLDPSQIPPATLEGLSGFSHCWILYVFHLNTDLEKLWGKPTNSKFKAKVRVPRLKGGKMGVFATRSPHRPCPIGLTVAKIEGVHGCMVSLSGVDLVDGTPVLDIKPYLPYSDSIKGATVPEWLEEECNAKALAVSTVDFSPSFFESLSLCWATMEKQSFYSSPSELQCLIEQVLSWDIRSFSQQNRPHTSTVIEGDGESETQEISLCSDRDVAYHLILEGIDVSYRIDVDLNVMVEKAAVSFNIERVTSNRCSHMMWGDIQGIS
ncbi:uncharacterized protein LOC18435423 isoform X1 [Amborella trichopoda]|nr:uncharacterized protein LOC18435423 isoform X1 [Amborella trichopoda]|eukprot:XP_011623810.2 uncharacterized protein LOC18435423 isoform X1 [Amborella trichopoda]